MLHHQGGGGSSDTWKLFQSRPRDVRHKGNSVLKQIGIPTGTEKSIKGSTILHGERSNRRIIHMPSNFFLY